MAAGERVARVGVGSVFRLIAVLLLLAVSTAGRGGVRIVSLDISTSESVTGSWKQLDSPDADTPSHAARPTAASGYDANDYPEYNPEVLECTIENSRVWTECGSCQCCYKPKEIRANCLGNLTEIPTDLPENITHLTLRETDIVRIPAMVQDHLKISKFSIYPELIQLELKDNEKLKEIDEGAFDFDPLVVSKSSLKNIFIDGSPNLKEIKDGAFGYFHSLSDIKIVYCGLTRPPLWKRDAFSFNHEEHYVHTIYMMDLSHNKISEIPENVFDVTQEVKIGTVDLSFNKIRHLKSGTIKGSLEIGTLKLRHNLLESIDGYAFNGSKINNLLLSDNGRLTTLDVHTFSNTDLEHLDLSRTAVRSLPTAGLRTLKNLTIEGTFSLQTFPSVFEMEQMKGARLTYAHHCCAFHHPEKQNKTAYDIFRREMEAECLTTTTTSRSPSPTDVAAIIRAMTTTSTTTAAAAAGIGDGFGGFGERRTLPRGIKRRLLSMRKLAMEREEAAARRRRAFGQDKAFEEFRPRDGANRSAHGGQFDARGQFYDIREPADVGDVDRLGVYADDDDDAAAVGRARAGFGGGSFHTSTLDPRETYRSTERCGELVEHIKRVACTPAPDAFNPCEDVLGPTWLRVVAWLVVVAAELGNVAVIVVTACSKYRLAGLTVSKFLICNLAFADLTLGAYLLVLAAFDLSSKGRYFTHAIVWQYEGGCQVAGFLATFSTCLSTFTLTVITLERWYTIRYAMNPDKRLRLRHAAAIMACGWTLALAAGALPLLGVSSFSKTSICLPMETGRPADGAYVVALMLLNAGCFVVICACYADMYCKVRANSTSSAVGRSDANVAKRMASLVFTDFVCLFPIVFFGLTAAAGRPLIDVTDSKILLVVFFPLNACANPFLYVIATKHFRKDLVGMLSRCGFCERKASEYRLAMMSNPMSMSHSRNSLSGVAQNAIHRPSVGSTLTSTTTTSTGLLEHQRASRGSPSAWTNGASKSGARASAGHCPGPAASDVGGCRGVGVDLLTPTPTERNVDARKLSVVPEGNAPQDRVAAPPAEGAAQRDATPEYSRDGRPPGRRSRSPHIPVRSVSQYSSQPLIGQRAPSENGDVFEGKAVQEGDEGGSDLAGLESGSFGNGGGLRRPAAAAAESDRIRRRPAKHSIPGDSGFGEADSAVLETDNGGGGVEAAPGRANNDRTFHSSSTDTSICPMSDKTSSSNGNGEEPMPCPLGRPYAPPPSPLGSRDAGGRKDGPLDPERKDCLAAGAPHVTYRPTSGRLEGYTNSSYSSEELRLHNAAFS